MADIKEIERIWILKEMPPAELIYSFRTHIISYILNNKFGEMRLVEKFMEGGPKYLLTVKSRGTLSRDEWEEKIPSWVFDFLVKETKYSLKKTRHFVMHEKYNLEVDLYLDRYIIDQDFGNYFDRTIADKIKMECEFKSEDEAKQFVLPEWAKDAVEVTYDARYKNSMIAKLGWPGENAIKI